MSVDRFVAIQRSEATKRNYAYDLGKWFAYLEGREPSESLALDFRTNLSEKMAATSAARIFNTCRTYYRWLGTANPFERVPSPKTVRNRIPKVPEDSQVAEMLERCESKRDKAVLALLLNGLRSSEVTRLTTEGWQWSEAYEVYIIGVVGKGEKARRVPATSETVQAVVDYLPERLQGSAWLLQAADGSRMTTRQVQYVAEKYSDYKIRPHRLRHHYATRLIRAGVSLEAVRDLLGHEDIQTTQIYISLDFADIIREAQKDPRNATPAT